MDEKTMSNYKKYLKYKKKYLELKYKLKGGDLPCIIPENEPNSNLIPSFGRNQALYDVFYMGFYQYKFMTPQLIPSTDLISKIRNIYRLIEDSGYRLSYDMEQRVIIENPTNPRGMEIEDQEDESRPLTKIDVLLAFNKLAPDPTINQVFDPSNLSIGLLESVLGSTLNISCNNRIQELFENSVRDTAIETYIIDYQNVLHKLIDNERSTMVPLTIPPAQRNNYFKFRAVARIKKFVSQKLSTGNIVIIVYKPSGSLNQPGQVPTPPDSVINQATGVITRDLLLQSFFATDPQYNLGLAEEAGWNLNIKNSLNDTLYVINYFMVSNPANSSYDDLIFWMLGICFFRIYERFGKTTNIYLITNDKQRLVNQANNTIPPGPITSATMIPIISPFIANPQFKNILDLGPAYNNVQIIKYLKLGDNVIARTVPDDNLVDNLISYYLALMYQGCNNFINYNGTLTSASTFSGIDIYNTIYAERFNYSGVNSSIIGFLIDRGMGTLLDLNKANGTLLYTIPYFFYAHIKYIQYIKFGDLDGSYTDTQITNSFTRL